MKVLMVLVLRLECVRRALANYSDALAAAMSAACEGACDEENEERNRQVDKAEQYVKENIAAAAVRKIMAANEQFGEEDAEWLEEEVRSLLVAECERVLRLRQEIARRNYDEGYQVERAIEERNHEWAFDQTEQMERALGV